jgi:hypothetical protein
MAERSRQPEKVTNKNDGLEIVEYVSALGAVVGTIAAVVSQQAIYAAAPLSLSIVLNLINRRRLDQLTRQRTFADTTHVQRQLSEDVRSLRQQILDLPVSAEQVNLSNIKESLAELYAGITALETEMQSRFAPLQRLDLNALQEDISQLHSQYASLMTSLDHVTDQMSSLPASDSTASLEREIAQLKIDIALIEQSREAQPPISEPFDPTNLRTEMQAMLAPLQGQMAALESKMNDLPIVDPAIPEYQLDQVNGLNGQVENLGSRLESVSVQVSEGIAGLQRLFERSESRIEEMNHQLSAVQLEQDQPPISEPFDPTNLHTEMQAMLAPLQGQMAALESKMNDLPIADPTLPQYQLDQLGSLQSQVDSLGAKIESVLEQLSTEIADIPNLVERTVQNRIDEVNQHSTPAQKDLELSDLDSLLSDLNIELE